MIQYGKLITEGLLRQGDQCGIQHEGRSFEFMGSISPQNYGREVSSFSPVWRFFRLETVEKVYRMMESGNFQVQQSSTSLSIFPMSARTPYEWARHYYEEARKVCLLASKDKSPRNRYHREVAADLAMVYKRDLARVVASRGRSS